MIGVMTIGQLARSTGLSVRTLRFYADEGVLPEAGRTESGYRLFGPEAVVRGRLVRTLRELGVGLADIKRVLTAEASLAEIAAAHALALDAQIRSLQTQRAVLRAVARSTGPAELERMSGLTTLTVDERRRMLEEYLEAVFAGQPNPVADRLRQGAPELPEDPTPAQIAAWVELAGLLRDPEYIQASRRMAQRAGDDDPEPDGGHPAAAAIGEHAAAAVRSGLDPSSPDALAVIEQIEALTPGVGGDRVQLAERIEAFTDPRVFRYWTLVGIINAWPQGGLAPEGTADAWEWYARALRANA
jgi:DNA-binding transcriptional MerR regulator